jgi:hypothetical protein
MGADKGCLKAAPSFNHMPTIVPCMNSEEERELLKDLVWLNAVIATELIQITENVSSILRNAPPPESCREDHNCLRDQALLIAEKYSDVSALRKHLTGHQ